MALVYCCGVCEPQRHTFVGVGAYTPKNSEVAQLYRVDVCACGMRALERLVHGADVVIDILQCASQRLHTNIYRRTGSFSRTSVLDKSKLLRYLFSATQLMRFAMLSHRLVFMQARGEVDLSGLVAEGLILPHEIQLLQDRPAKAMIVWGWCVVRHVRKLRVEFFVVVRMDIHPPISVCFHTI